MNWHNPVEGRRVRTGGGRGWRARGEEREGRGEGLRRVTVRNRSSLPDFLFVVKWAAPAQISYNTSSVGTDAFSLSNDLL